MDTKVNKPYPEIKVTVPNETYGLMILDNVGGMNSETSAICQYIYNHSIAGEDFLELKKNIFKYFYGRDASFRHLHDPCLRIRFRPPLVELSK